MSTEPHSDIIELCLRIDAFVAAASDQAKQWTNGFDEGHARAVREAVKILEGIRGVCWCEHGTGNPMVQSHSQACEAARLYIAASKMKL